MEPVAPVESGIESETSLETAVGLASVIEVVPAVHWAKFCSGTKILGHLKADICRENDIKAKRTG